MTDLSEFFDAGSGVKWRWTPAVSTPDGPVRSVQWWHDCPSSPDHLKLRWVDLLSLGEDGGPREGGHELVSASPLSIVPAVRCDACGLEGLFREGRFVGVDEVAEAP